MDSPLANLRSIPSDNDSSGDSLQISPVSSTFAESAAETTESETVVAIIGVGFVGESLLTEFSKRFSTIGYDISSDRIDELQNKYGHLESVELTREETPLSRATHYLISVPTLLRPDRSINLDYVHAAFRTVLNHARPGCTVVIESSVSVGTTRSMLGPHRHIFHCGMSPERVDPGRTSPSAAQIPKVVSGLGSRALKQIVSLYEKVFETVVPVSKPEVAEMTKLFENCYRLVNIAYVNEMRDACRGWGIDPMEMINAASTKPYGFQSFYPGLGVGGHCIPINPFYLLANNKNLPILERSAKLMWNRPKKLARNFHRRCISTSTSTRANTSRNRSSVSSLPRILLVGVGFKPGQAVLSCSPGLSFAESLKASGCSRLAFYDPLVQQSHVPWMEKLEERNWNASYLDRAFDGIAVCMRQSGVEFTVLDKLKKTLVREFV